MRAALIGSPILSFAMSRATKATGLADASGAPLSPDYTPYPTASYLYNSVTYGYGVMIPGKKFGRWTLNHMTYEGQQFDTCSLVAKSLTCASQ